MIIKRVVLTVCSNLDFEGRDIAYQCSFVFLAYRLEGII